VRLLEHETPAGRALPDHLHSRRTDARPGTGAIITPIFQTSTYVQEELGKHKGYEYARTQNPTRAALEANIAAIEGGTAAFAFASGWRPSTRHHPGLERATTWSATDNSLRRTSGCSTRLRTRYQLAFSYVDTSSDLIAQAMRTNTNALRRDADQPGDAPDGSGQGGRDRPRAPPRLVVDNTFASPVVQQPIAFGADLVVHRRRSTSTATATASAGRIATRDEDVEWLQFIQNAAGAILSPFDSWLVLRGTKTLTCGWRSTTPTAWRSPSSSRRTRRSRR
jgi:cystathionine beta-lyase/cystathionine gamma-synthase